MMRQDNSRLLHIVRRDMLINDALQQRLGFWQIRSNKGTERKELTGDIGDGVGMHKWITTGGNHHRVVDHRNATSS